MDNFDQLLDVFTALAVSYGPRVILSLIILVFGLWIINRLVTFIDHRLSPRFDPTLVKFSLSLTGVGLKALLLISVASMVGIATTSFIAVLGAAGLAVGLALQGNLANFASGVLILAFKPFKVGDTVTTSGFSGVVREIQIFQTVLTTFDNQRVIIPNSAITGSPVVNINAEATRRVDMKFGIAYDDDIATAKQLLATLVTEDQRILADPEPTIALAELGDSSVNFVVRVWVNTADYWPVFFAMQENVKTRFDQAGLTFPFPQRDVHLFPASAD